MFVHVILKKVILLFVLLKSTEAIVDLLNDAVNAVAPLSECILPNTWTEWIEEGTCGRITRKRFYRFYMCE